MTTDGGVDDKSGIMAQSLLGWSEVQRPPSHEINWMKLAMALHHVALATQKYPCYS